MSGIKGRSGRRKIKDEEKRRLIIDKAYDVVFSHLVDPLVPSHEKVEIATRIVVKDIPSNPLVNVNQNSVQKNYIFKWKDDNERVSLLQKTNSAESLVR